jgi:hypothetical protein
MGHLDDSGAPFSLVPSCQSIAVKRSHATRLECATSRPASCTWEPADHCVSLLADMIGSGVQHLVDWHLHTRFAVTSGTSVCRCATVCNNQALSVVLAGCI